MYSAAGGIRTHKGEFSRRILSAIRRPFRHCSMSSHRTRLKLIKEGVKKHQCEMCGTKEWLGKPVPLELDHKDGDTKNNSLENLRILCCNCHAQTENWRGRKLKKAECSHICQSCFRTKVSRINLSCRSCAAKSRKTTKIDWPKRETLANMVKRSSYRKVGILLGVSDNAVRKRLANY